MTNGQTEMHYCWHRLTASLTMWLRLRTLSCLSVDDILKN